MTPAPFTLPGATTHRRHGAASGGDYLIDIAIPDSQPPPGGFPLVLLLDGGGCFATCVEASRRMGRRPDATAVSPLVVAAVRANGAGSPASRQFDFTSAKADRPESGGAPGFLAFLQNEVLPLAASMASLNPARRTLFGHSLAGYFTLWTLAHHPAAFRNFAAVSPAVWWACDSLLQTLATAPLSGQRVLLALGDWEEQLPPWQLATKGAEAAAKRRAERQVRAGIEQVAALLTSRLGRDSVRFHLLPEEDHASIVSAAITRTLRMACLV